MLLFLRKARTKSPIEHQRLAINPTHISIMNVWGDSPSEVWLKLISNLLNSGL